jgi:hypothetical protein
VAVGVGSSGRVPAWQPPGPKFKLSTAKKKRVKFMVQNYVLIKCLSEPEEERKERESQLKVSLWGWQMKIQKY